MGTSKRQEMKLPATTKGLSLIGIATAVGDNGEEIDTTMELMTLQLIWVILILDR